MFGALAYNQNKVDSGEAKVLFSNRMLLGEDGNFSIGECMRSFEMQMPVQLSTKKPILHISINPHPEDCSHCHADRPQPQGTGTTAKEAGH